MSATGEPLTPRPSHHLRERQPLRVVAIGGGTGLSTILRGLKPYVIHEDAATTGDRPMISDLAAIVTVTDDGGSSGILRKEMNMLPPGDIRNCMVALSEDEALLSRLFQYRFSTGGLQGHSFGNLFLAALTEVTGDFAEAVKLSSQILASRGHIFPSTNSYVQLDATMDDGSRVRGETRITASDRRIMELRLVPANAKPLPQTLQAIRDADLITMGPGSLFTSLIPNVLVRGIPEAIAASSATKVFICNLMTQANESLGLTAADHIRNMRRHARRKLFHYIMVNTSPLPRELQARYALEGASQIVCDRDAIAELGLELIEGDFLNAASGTARHAVDRVAHEVLTLAERCRSTRWMAASAQN